MPSRNPAPIFSSIALALILQACTYTRAVTQTNVPANRENPVEVEVKRYIFFATFDTDETQSLITKLQEKCPGGRVRGITTKDLRTYYFFFIFWARETVANGYCLKEADKTADVEENAAPLVAGETR